MCSRSRLNDDVIDVDLLVVADLLPETPLHAPLEGGPHVPKVERHRGVAEGADGGDEGRGQLVEGVHRDLVVIGVCVQKVEGLTTGGGVDHLVHPRKGERILETGLVEASVVHAYSPIPILLLDQAVDDLTPQHHALRRQTTTSILSYYNLSFKDTLMNH